MPYSSPFDPLIPSGQAWGMRGLEVGLGAVQIALGLVFLVRWVIDQRREPARRRIQPRSFRAWTVVMGLFFLVNGSFSTVRGLGG
jgi:hypothetical protein